MRPSYLPVDVLWYYDDCLTDRKYGTILTESNKSRPRMSIIIRQANGDLVPSNVFKATREHADLVVRRLLEGISTDPRIATAKSLTKSLIKSLFYEEFCQAILDLEAEKRELRLCSGHWKAEVMLSQALLRRSSGPDTNAAKDVHTASDVGASLPPPPSPTGSLKVVAPMHTTKRALELNPGPKSPSVLHVQKRVKHDGTILGQKNSSLVPSREYCILHKFKLLTNTCIQRISVL